MPNKQLVLEHTPECKHKDFQSVLAPEDFDDVQGDILLQFPKRTEDFVFFHILNIEKFREALKLLLEAGKISSTSKVKKDREEIAEWKNTKQQGLKVVENTNISFTYSGLKKLGFNVEDLPESGRKILEKGQLKDAASLHDLLEDKKPKPEDKISRAWDKVFKDGHDRIDGVLLIASESAETVNKCRSQIQKDLEGHIEVVHHIHGDTRADVKENGESLKDHEHFGWKDGISNPWLEGVFCTCRRIPEQPIIQPGTILVGYPNKHNQSNKLDKKNLARNGSYLVFRKIDQLVPEFHKWLQDNPVPLNRLDFPEISDDELRKRGAELRGAQLVGRWKKGTPLERSHHGDDPSVWGDPKEINKFGFTLGNRDICPFSAHIRKMNPRDDQLDFGKNFLVRAGITYGEEVTESEKSKHKTNPKSSRGLAFVSYQADIDAGFRFQQTSWANEKVFPPTGPMEFGPTGLDPLIGQTGNEDIRPETLDTKGNTLTLEQFVIARGGVYCFTPSIKALKNIADGTS
ncbi:Dye-decolorizing peroxidase msp1 OS=Marasmius scorodonius GN=msp1 PE=1 SV=1 [Rhizoctonia solani AG-1 IB]|uniref:Dye-decolorizing peroxidase msp1 n=1 Tax=Thanatephorus cucumeris (strain AG1-IB / isolate 7/3/14) TaxID=1108050 RepID=M5CBE5_THACB|nr:Peroxidase 1 Short=MsP1 [Rhizoctonia solani AG-1 IB]CEL60047.1 Dye-decolorizing peroxidase msp1 OS=Marasmius scorodonius GN=msp1 PE=1 SV=1 [Rhizoctonia solani AG-1 IB]